MNKTIIAMIVVIISITGVIFGVNIYERQQYKNRMEISKEETLVDKINNQEEILDECTEEWESKNNKESETLQVNSTYEKEDKQEYILRNDKGKIVIYKINEDKKEEVYELTDIAVDYLTDEDKNNLNNGIRVYGKESLNQLIEDFE